MKYPARMYAAAFAELAAGRLKPEDEKRLTANLVKLAARNGDSHQLPAILKESDRLLRMKTGMRKVTVESARPLTKKMQDELAKVLKKDDVLETRIDPGLVAGVKLTVDEQSQFDGSLRRKLDRLFILEN